MANVVSAKDETVEFRPGDSGEFIQRGHEPGIRCQSMGQGPSPENGRRREPAEGSEDPNARLLLHEGDPRCVILEP